ncbi:MAG TPA: kelch repeat-containing protein [bacterium]
MNNRFLVCLVLFLSLGFAQKKVVKKSDVVRLSPRLLNYQGYLTDTLGNPITNSSLSLSFAIFDSPSGGSQKWTETQSSVSVDKGIFNVLLGSVTPIPDSVFTASTNRYLQLTVAGQVVSPRTPIVSMGYAYTSTYSDTAQYARAAPTTGVPQGYCILGPTTTPPPGYTYIDLYSDFTRPESWQTRADMPTGRSELAVVEVNGRIYALGGLLGGNVPINTNEEYDPVSNTWRPREVMLANHAGFGAAAINGKIYSIGGWAGGSFTEEYDPIANTWQVRAYAPISLQFFGCCAVNGRIYVIGGGSGAQTGNYEYNPDSNTWRSRADMPTGRRYLAAVAVNGKIYAIGGQDGSNNPLQTNEEYDPVTNTWQTRANMPTARFGLAAVGANGKVYALGGWNTGSAATNEEYDPVTNTWQTRVSMPTARAAFGACVVSSKIYAIGGNGGDQKNEEYQSLLVKYYLHMKN